MSSPPRKKTNLTTDFKDNIQRYSIMVNDLLTLYRLTDPRNGLFLF